MNKAAQQLGKLGGKVKSEAKTKTAQENGKKGGRPKKDRVLEVTQKHYGGTLSDMDDIS